jgi:hypothetical protein
MKNTLFFYRFHCLEQNVFEVKNFLNQLISFLRTLQGAAYPNKLKGRKRTRSWLLKIFDLENIFFETKEYGKEWECFSFYVVC